MTRFVVALAIFVLFATVLPSEQWRPYGSKGPDCWYSHGHKVCGWGGRMAGRSSPMEAYPLPEGCTSRPKGVYCYGIPVEPVPTVPGCYINDDMMFCVPWHLRRPGMKPRSSFGWLFGGDGQWEPTPCWNPRSMAACFKRID